MQKRPGEKDKNTPLPRTKTTRYITAHILYVGLGVEGRCANTHTAVYARADGVRTRAHEETNPHSLHRLQAHRPGSHMGKVLMAAFLKHQGSPSSASRTSRADLM